MAAKKAKKSVLKTRQCPEPKKTAKHPEATQKTEPQPQAVPPETELPSEVMVLDDGAPSLGVGFCENCEQPIDIESAEAFRCPECGGLGSDQCCMDKGEDESCKLCRQEVDEEEVDKEGKEGDSDEDDYEEDDLIGEDDDDDAEDDEISNV